VWGRVVPLCTGRGAVPLGRDFSEPETCILQDDKSYEEISSYQTACEKDRKAIYTSYFGS